MHRFAEAIAPVGVKPPDSDDADFHQAGSKARCRQSHFLRGNNAKTSTLKLMSVMPEHFCLQYRAMGEWLIFNQNGSYSFGFREGDGFPERPEPVLCFTDILMLYTHCASQNMTNNTGIRIRIRNWSGCIINAIE